MHAAIRDTLLVDFRCIRFVTGPRPCKNVIKDRALQPYFHKHSAYMFEGRYLVDALWKEPEVITLMADLLFALPDKHSASVIKRFGTLYKSLRMPHRTEVIKTVLKLLKGRLWFFAKLELIMIHRLCDTPIFFYLCVGCSLR